MDRFEELSRSLQRQGYHVHLQRQAVTWRCDLACGVDVLDAAKPRPWAIGPTALAAAEAAAALIQPQKPKQSDGTLAAGLPRGGR